MSIPPTRREIRVAATADRTFSLFTDRIGDWWPLGDYAVYGDGTVAFEGKDVVERAGDRATIWAEVTEWHPPRVLRLSWHPGGTVERAADLRVYSTHSQDSTGISHETCVPPAGFSQDRSSQVAMSRNRRALDLEQTEPSGGSAASARWLISWARSAAKQQG